MKNLSNKNNNYLPLFIIINIFLLFFLPSSIIYNLNTGLQDAGIYQLISKEMLNGKILYKDIFDIKGPFIFFIYSIAHLIKNINLGMFIIDLLLFNIIFYLNYKIMKINTQNNKFIYFLTILEMLIIYIPYKIVSPETFMLLTITYINYWILSKQYLNPTFKQLLTCGILTGLIFWIKYSLCIYIGIIYLYFAYMHIKNKTFNYKYILYPLIGFLIPTAIVFGYFIYNNAISDLFNVYFLQSLKYKNTSYISINYNIIILFFMIIFISIINKKNITLSILNIGYITLFITTFMISKNNFDYYYIPFLSIIALLSNIKINEKYLKIFNIVNNIFITAAIIFIFILLQNRYIIINDYSKNNNIETQIYETINDTNHENIISLLTSDTDMLTKVNNINYKYPFLPYFTYNECPEIYDTLIKDIKNKNIEYILLQKTSNRLILSPKLLLDNKSSEKIDEITKVLYENYDLVKTFTYKYNNNYIKFTKYNTTFFKIHVENLELYKRK